ncbi:MAG: hypothetical protein DMF78_15570 [Acidobacteria bacterium]|nr:MAG: hypothetical protein DMF78_15570 [Acidobacteriota bacterium]
MSLALFHAIIFYVFGGLALGGAIVMVSQRNPTYSAFALIVTLVSLSGVFGLLGSPFIAVLVRAERPAVGGFHASATQVAQLLFSPQYLYVFEATSILILAALVGAVALAKRDARP